jgi:hypothetical protein
MEDRTMKATQSEIARRTGLHVSSVCKILGSVPGCVFDSKTIDRVREMAERVGYRRRRPSRWELLQVIALLEGAAKAAINHLITCQAGRIFKSYKSSSLPLLQSALTRSYRLRKKYKIAAIK